MNMNKLFDQVWFSENLSNVIFSDEEMDRLMDNVIGSDGLPNLKNGFVYEKKFLVRSYTQSEILNATPEERIQMIKN